MRYTAVAARAFAVCALGFVMAALVYTFVATPQRVQDRFDNETAFRARTDEGLAYMQGAVFPEKDDIVNLVDDYEGIRWMRENVQGSPTIIEGVTTPYLYHWGGRYTINTGLPAVAGWDWHQKQQRTQFTQLVDQRQADVMLFYNTTDPAEAHYILNKYDVRYVVVGKVEKVYFPDGIAKFSTGLGGMLRQVFSYGETSIYEVVDGGALISGRS